MKEIYEFRVPAEKVESHLGVGLGSPLGEAHWIRVFRLQRSDPLFARIGACEQSFMGGGKFFHGWSITRKYTAEELRQAECFKLHINRAFEPFGEVCGTVYDDATACPKCGAGAPQLTPLRLRIGKIPGGVDISRTIASEQVVTRHFKEVCEEAGLTGIEFLPVEDSGKSRLPQPSHFQLRFTSPRLQVSRHTVAGSAPFDETAYGKCSQGDTVGLNILSELFLEPDSKITHDFAETEQYFGHRMGVLRPSRIIVVSPRAREVLIQAHIKSLYFEVAHLK